MWAHELRYIFWSFLASFGIIKMCYVHNQWYVVSCATLYYLLLLVDLSQNFILSTNFGQILKHVSNNWHTLVSIKCSQAESKRTAKYCLSPRRYNGSIYQEATRYDCRHSACQNIAITLRHGDRKPHRLERSRPSWKLNFVL